MTEIVNLQSETCGQLFYSPFTLHVTPLSLVTTPSPNDLPLFLVRCEHSGQNSLVS